MKNPNIPKKQKGILEDIHSTVNFLAMFDTLEGISFFAKDRDFCLIYANPTFYQRLGLKSQKELLGKNDFELFPEHDLSQIVLRDGSLPRLTCFSRRARSLATTSGFSR